MEGKGEGGDHSKSLKEHCKIVCPSCKCDYRGKEIVLQSHLAHFKSKHGGFISNQVSGQNCFEEFIPGLVEIGEEEREERTVYSPAA